MSRILEIRGGVGRSPYESIPTYIPPQGSQYQQELLARPLTLGDLEGRSLEPVGFERQSHSQPSATSNWSPRNGAKLSPLQRIQTFSKNVHQTSPTLSLTSLACLVIYLSWQIPAFHQLLQSYFVCSRFNVQKGRLPSIFLSAVSHTTPTHLLMNMFAYLTLGPSLQHTLKRSNWSLYPLVLGATIAGSLAFLILGGNGGCLGLSGVTLAMMALQSKLSPDREFRMMVAVFPVKLKADMALTCMLIWSVIGSIARNSQVAHTAHLGGLLFGMAYYEVWLRRNEVKWYVNRAKAALPKFGGGSKRRTR